MRSNDMSPVTLPRHFTTDYVMGRVTDDLGTAVTRAACDGVAGQGRGRHRGDRARRRGRRHRPVERARGGDARRAGHHRQRGRHGPADRRDRAQPRPLRARTACGCSGRSSTRSTSRPHPDLPEVLEPRPGAARGRAARLHPVSPAARQPVARADRHPPRRRAAGRGGDAGRDDRPGGHRRHAGRPRGAATCAIGRCSSRPATARTCWRWRWRRIGPGSSRAGGHA